LVSEFPSDLTDEERARFERMGIPPPKLDRKPDLTMRRRQGYAMKAVFDAVWRGADKLLVALPTGVGKTVLAALITTRYDRALFLVHREELLDQTVAAYRRVSPTIDLGTVHRGAKGDPPNTRFTVGMIQTVHSRLDRFDPRAYDIVVIDECHHAVAKTWRTVAEHFEPKLRLGLSATPEREDGAPLNDMFSEIAYECSIKDAIDEDLLVRPRAIRVETTVSLDDIRVLRGDFDPRQLQGTLNTPARNEIIADTYVARALGVKCIIFCSGVEHAQSVAAALSARGVSADWVSGDDPKRGEKVKAFQAGAITVITNANLLTEGFDDPSVAAIFIARPIKSRPLYAQIIGRGLRLADHKDSCLIVDFADVTRKYHLLTPWNFFGIPTPPAGQGLGLGEAPPLLKWPSTKEQEARGRLEALGFELPDEHLVAHLHEIDLLAPPPAPKDVKHPNDWDTETSWWQQPASPKQVQTLEANGIPAEGWTKGQAARKIASLPPSPRQVMMLVALGCNVFTKDWSCDQADAVITAARKQGRKMNWRFLGKVMPGMWELHKNDFSPFRGPVYPQPASKVDYPDYF
jgi:superfamily II DNA or RNA helicase